MLWFSSSYFISFVFGYRRLVLGRIFRGSRVGRVFGFVYVG